jgi:C_GCAxxG_C_C family probable redox protein
VLLAVCKATGIDYSCIPTIAKGFSVGMGGVGEVCGAVSGGALAIGLLFEDDFEVVRKTKDFSRRFREQNRALRCIDLLGLGEVSTDELVGYAKQHKSEVCDGLVSDAVQILLDLLEDVELSKS